MRKQTQTTEITTEAQADGARSRVADLTRTIDDLDAQHADVSQRIGEALGDIALGDKDAKTTAGTLALKRSGLDAERRDLALTRDALRANVAAWDAAEAERRGKAAVIELAALTTTARRLEEQLGEQLIAAVETAQRLQETATAWQRARREAGRHADVTTFVAPRSPGFAGLQARLLTDPRGTVARWLGKSAAPMVSDRGAALAEEQARANATRSTAWSTMDRIDQPVMSRLASGGRR